MRDGEHLHNAEPLRGPGWPTNLPVSLVLETGGGTGGAKQCFRKNVPYLESRGRILERE